MNLELDLVVARRRAAQSPPFSPAWDAAMAEVEELEREVRGQDQVADGSSMQPAPIRQPSGS